MTKKPHQSSESAELTSFVTARHYIVGAGETLDELQLTGEWLATEDPADIRR